MSFLIAEAEGVRPVPVGFLAPEGVPAGVEMLFGTRAQSYPGKHHPNPDGQIAALTEKLGPMAHLRQVHSDRVVVAKGSGVFEEADALVTMVPGLWLAVKTADCVPVLLAAVGGHARGVAAVHAGWRGLESGIIGKAVEALCGLTGLEPMQVVGVIGPHISQPHYEVEESFRARFDGDFFMPSGPGKVKLDMRAVATDQLRVAGLARGSIHGLERCTFGEPEVFNSYRRTVKDGTPFANNLSLVRVRE